MKLVYGNKIFTQTLGDGMPFWGYFRRFEFSNGQCSWYYLSPNKKSLRRIRNAGLKLSI
jgi:hypothetical protein